MKNQNIMALLEAFGAEVDEFSKQASIGDNVDAGTSPASEGSRSSENGADVKKQVALNVDGSPVNKDDGSSKGPSNGMGVSHGPTGEDVPSTKDTKDDPGTSHPAKAASLRELVALGNEINADIVVSIREHEKQAAAKAEAEKSAAAKPAQEPVKEPEAKPAEVEKQASAEELSDEQLGYMVGQYITERLEKQASAQEQDLTKVAEAEVQVVMERAQHLAKCACDFLDGFTKKSNEGMPPMDPAAAMDPAAMGGAPAPAAPGGEDPLAGLPPELVQVVEQLLAAGMTPEQILAALEGGAGGEGGAPAGDPAAIEDEMAGQAAAAPAATEKAAANKKVIAKVASAIEAKIKANKTK